MTQRLLLAIWLLAAGGLVHAQPVPSAGQARTASPVAGPVGSATPTQTDGDVLALEGRLRARPSAAADALEAAAQRAPAGSARQVELLVGEAAYRAVTHDGAAVEQLAQRLETLAGPVAQAGALAVRADWQIRHESLGRAERLLTDALALLPANAPVSLRVRLMRRHGRALEGLGRLEASVRVQQLALQLSEPFAPAWLKSEQRAALAYTYHLAEQPDRAWSLNAEALDLARAAADELALSGAMTTQGILLGARGRVAEELQAMQAAIDHAQRAGAKREEVLGMANLADFYLKRQEFATALDLARRALPLAREVRDPITESVALANAGLALIALGKTDEGLRLVRQSLLLEERAGSITAMAQIELELGLTLERAGHLPQAWSALMEHRRLAAEVFQREHQQAMLELQEGFDHDTRQRELALLKAENALKEAQLEGRQLRQQLSAGAVAAGVLLLAVVVVLVRRMRHSNRALRDSNALLKVASERDPLTGLANRRHFQAVMQQAQAATALADTTGTADAADALEGSLLLIDVDHFKRINDTHGHAAGDAVLVEVAARLVATLREQDLTVRWGGEEFLVYTRGLPPEQVDVMAERLLAAIGGTPVKLGAQRIAVTASIGFATFPMLPERRPIDWERAVDLVDKAMYLAKAHGRNRAYGVRALTTDHRRPGTAPDELESAWRSGRADLSRVDGPVLETAPQGDARSAGATATASTSAASTASAASAAVDPAVSSTTTH
jgi:diguanylate cyclase (GGDEF)-like protein